ncbi:hypothetical protein LTR29_017150 [Friedmanniomyces endolithicus]|nr:hypothetical protein LTR29_017150 [Friedmanniomyces endolithicus]
MADESLYARLKVRNCLLEVAMNQTSILRPGSQHLAIGTKDLRGCSGIAVIGDAIILSLILPLPTEQSHSSTSSDAGLRHFADKMAEVHNLFIAHRALFREGTAAWGIFARYKEEVPLDHHLQLAARVFSSLGLSVTPAFYDIYQPRRTNPPPGNEAQLYVEDELKRRNEINRPDAAQHADSVSAVTSNSVRRPTQEHWVFTGALYVRYQGTTPLSSQQNPPTNTLISTENGQVLWDGREWHHQPRE